MSMKFVNRICPNCNNPNYMVLFDDFSREYKYKCMNCHMLFNDIDFWKELPQPVWKTECMNSKVDMVEVVRCKDCKHWEESTGHCPYNNIFTVDDWFCADGVAEDDIVINKEGR